MTIKEALESIERLYPNSYSVEDKINWLSELDSAVLTNIIRHHHNPVEDTFSTNGSTTEFTLAHHYDAIRLVSLKKADGSVQTGFKWTYYKNTKKIVFAAAPDAGTMTVEGDCWTYDTNYTEDTNPNTTLLIAKPYEQVYIYWLQSKIDYFNGEIGRYNNSSAMYDSLYGEYVKWYTQTHKPIESGWNYL